MPTPSRALQEIVEYRGVEGLVAAKVLTDDDDNGYTTGPVFAVAGVAEVSKTTDSSNEAHYYDNIPAVVIASTSADTITISASAIPLDVLAEITGQNYDSTLAAFIEGERDFNYFAIGYKTKKTNGDEVYVWRYKGTFNVPDQTNSTENNGTDANGQQIVYTGISTTHKFTKTGKGAKAINVDERKGHADVSEFFDNVTTPDDLQTKTAYTLTLNPVVGSTLTVTRNGEALANNAQIYDGDRLVITATATAPQTAKIQVNSTDFASGGTYIVTGATTVVTTLVTPGN